ncbi:hypothetical protein NX059_003664 [Plenodomus lindquistii]|nr:hypothetical protein NX059_003664 [Plenodomus lindquistii]
MSPLSTEERKFSLNGFRAPVTVIIQPTVKIDEQQLLNFPAFKNWQGTLQTNLELQYNDQNHAFYGDPYTLRQIKVQSVDWFGPTKIGFVKIDATIMNRQGKDKALPGISFLRGGSVAMLMVLRPRGGHRDERLVVMTEQPRVPAGSLAFVEIPAGMLDDSKNFAGKAADEIEEETGFKLPPHELINLTELALTQSSTEGESLQNAMYPSPGGSDEFMPIYLWEKELDRQEIMGLRGKLTGERRQGEMIRLRLFKYEELWKVCARDAKTLAAWALYEGLNRAGILQKEMARRKQARHLDATTV